MKYSTYSISINIIQILYRIIFINIITATNNATIITNKNYNEKNSLKGALDIGQPLTTIFPFLTLTEGLCVELFYKNYDSIDYLNLGECKIIKSFNLKVCNIKEIPEYIESFKSIHNLNFLSNQLTSSCFDIISQLSSLRSLNLGRNLIEKIPDNISKLVNLKELILSENSFTYVSNFLYKLKLKKLVLSPPDACYNNSESIKITEDIILKIMDELLKIETLEELIINDTNLSNLNFNEKKYYIKRLSFIFCKLSSLPNSISKLKRLEYLNLEFNLLQTVPNILNNLTSLKYLNLNGNNIKQYYNISFYSLETLYIQWNCNTEDVISIKNRSSLPLKHLHIDISTTNEQTIQFKQPNIESLNNLYLYGCTIGVAKNINILKNLEHLYIDGELIDVIIDCVLGLKNLKTLCVDFKYFEITRSIQHLFSGLTDLKNLESLSLKELTGNVLLRDELFDHDNLKKLYIYKFIVENITELSRLKNLKSVSFQLTKFSISKKEINTFCKQNKIKVTYKNCKFDV